MNAKSFRLDRHESADLADGYAQRHCLDSWEATPLVKQQQTRCVRTASGMNCYGQFATCRIEIKEQSL
jgi:hypothetical protein